MRRLPILLLWLIACAGDDPAPACLDDLPEACTPLYEPTFDEVWENTLSPSCGLSGCHDAGDARGGLVLDDPDAAYAALVDDGRVVPGDAACSLLIDRIDPAGRGTMPPGALLSESELCAVRQWVDAGAAR